MLKRICGFMLAAAATTFAATALQAGDAEERYFLVVASLKTKPFTEFSASEFLTDMARIEKQYSEQCGVEVAAWHSDLVEGFQAGYWFVYTESNEDKSAVEAFPREDRCSQNGYIKGGLVTFPGRIQMCAYCASNRCPDQRGLFASGYCD